MAWHHENKPQPVFWQSKWESQSDEDQRVSEVTHRCREGKETTYGIPVSGEDTAKGPELA